MGSPLRALPLLAWSTRFDRGQLALSARLTREWTWTGVEPAVVLPAGPLTVDLKFRGGPAPELDELVIAAGPVRVQVVDRDAQVNGELRPVTQPVHAVADLLDHLEDAVITVRARAADGLLIKLAPGLTATIPFGSEVQLEAHTSGPADRPRLRHPLVVSVDGAGLSIRLPGARWVNALRSLAIRRASLAPDGAVELHGHAATPLAHAVGMGLRQASHHLSEMVRNSPRFAGVREFLDE